MTESSTRRSAMGEKVKEKKADDKADGELTYGQTVRSVGFPRDGVLVRKIEALAERTKTKFSPMCVILLERGVQALEADADVPGASDRAEALGTEDWPAWLRAAICEAARIWPS